MMPQESRAVVLDQERARHAWDLIQALRKKKDNGQNLNKFETQVKKFPVRVLSSGLGQALAFLKAKEYAPDLQEDLGKWVAKKIPYKGAPVLLQGIIQGDSEFLRRATEEVLAYMQWVVRFAEANDLTKAEE